MRTDDVPLEIRVPEQADGTRLDRFLAEPLGSRAQAQGLIDGRHVRVDGHVRPKRHAVRAGELIVVQRRSNQRRIAWTDYRPDLRALKDHRPADRCHLAIFRRQ